MSSKDTDREPRDQQVPAKQKTEQDTKETTNEDRTETKSDLFSWTVFDLYR